MYKSSDISGDFEGWITQTALRRVEKKHFATSSERSRGPPLLFHMC